jgi:hypothetical protein
MTEKEWVALVVTHLEPLLAADDSTLRLEQGKRLAYAEEIITYRGQSAHARHTTLYETDLLISERLSDTDWVPRVVIEAKINAVTTHDAITYSHKAALHKAVHPYLRYGIILGHRGHFPLPGRLFRHGAHFDFMCSLVDFEPTPNELETLRAVILDEVRAGQALQEMIFDSRRPGRKHYTFLHRPLMVREPPEDIP